MIDANPAVPRDGEPAVINRLVRDFGATWIEESALSHWCTDFPHAVLLLAGDRVRFPEGQDVAAVLPELLKASQTPCRIGVVPRDEEDRVARRYGSQRWPSLLFFRQGAYATALPGMHDWDVYQQKFKDALAHAPSRAPTIGIPVVSAGGAPATSDCGH